MSATQIEDQSITTSSTMENTEAPAVITTTTTSTTGEKDGKQKRKKTKVAVVTSNDTPVEAAVAVDEDVVEGGKAPKKTTKKKTSAKTTKKAAVSGDEVEQATPKRTRARDANKNVQYTDQDGVTVPKRKVKWSRIFDVYCVRHNEPINLDEQETVCMSDWNPRLVARDFCLDQLIKKDKKLTGRRDIYVKERGISSIKTYGYVVRRRRVDDNDVKKVSFPGKNNEPAQFNFDVKLKHSRVNKKHLKSFKQQVMRRAGLSEEEIDGVTTEDEKPMRNKKGEIIPESDSEPEEDAPEKPEKAETTAEAEPIKAEE